MKTWRKIFLLIFLLTTLSYLFIQLDSTSKKPAPTHPLAIATIPITLNGTSAAEYLNNLSTCRIRGVLPDPSCTPGSIDPKVTQDNIYQTICVKGYTKTVRPPVSYTNKLKKQQIDAYGYADKNLRNYEEDHLISLELGGAPTDPKNLWPEPEASPNSKDRIENLCNKKVCSGEIALTKAQQEIAADWTTACQ